MCWPLYTICVFIIIIIIVICDRDSWARASGCTFVELHGQCYKNTVAVAAAAAAPDGVRPRPGR
jgi:hypothetical protein